MWAGWLLLVSCCFLSKNQWTGGDAVKVVVSTGSPDFSGGQESSEYSVGFVIVRMCVTEMPKRVIKTR